MLARRQRRPAPERAGPRSPAVFGPLRCAVGGSEDDRQGGAPGRRAIRGGIMALRDGQEAVAKAEMGTLRRSDPAGVGIRRRRCGRGFSYLRPDAALIRDPRTLARIRSLVIPPAWEDVCICADPWGHVQAIGTDS